MSGQDGGRGKEGKGEESQPVALRAGLTRGDWTDSSQVGLARVEEDGPDPKIRTRPRLPSRFKRPVRSLTRKYCCSPGSRSCQTSEPSLVVCGAEWDASGNVDGWPALRYSPSHMTGTGLPAGPPAAPNLDSAARGYLWPVYLPVPKARTPLTRGPFYSGSSRTVRTMGFQVGPGPCSWKSAAHGKAGMRPPPAATASLQVCPSPPGRGGSRRRERA